MSVMKIWYSLYTLKPQAGKSPPRRSQVGALGTSADQVKEDNRNREGALLRILWADGCLGYSDCFPWPEYGDRGVTEELHQLAKGRLSPLLEQSFWLARRDGVARKEKRHLLRKLPRVKNSLLILDVASFNEDLLGDAKRVGFTSAKVKVGNDPDKEFALIDRLIRMLGFTVRLDFNSKGTFDGVQKFLERFQPAIKPFIEYIEDPFPFDPVDWREINRLVPLALDWEWRSVNWERFVVEAPFKVIIIKPARQDVPSAIELMNRHGLRMVITSSLDHPVGIMHAAAVAGEAKKTFPNKLLDCGCFTHLAYQANEFAKLLPRQGPYISETPGYGVGFDEALGKCQWVELAVPKS
ncbi:MAG: hypothetical protein C5B49_16485 [Bdellovibrio sp.]|nr:MAG: hypothetical protein C5B49_16485 [Bdellovibrio sp.]